jgi:general secretion pathway protein F
MRELLAAGIESGRLPEVLRVLAEDAEANHRLTCELREIACYPLAIVGFAYLIFLWVLLYHIPSGYLEAVTGLSDGKVPRLTGMLFWLSAHLRSGFVMVLLLLPPCTALWLISDGHLAGRLLTAILRRLPLGGQLAWLADHERLCRLCAVHFEQQLPIVEAMAQIAPGLDSPDLRVAAADWSRAQQNGRSRAAAAAASPFDASFCLAVGHQPEGKLPEVSRRLAALYQARRQATRRGLLQQWTVWAALGGIILYSLMLAAMLTPLGQSIQILLEL